MEMVRAKWTARNWSGTLRAAVALVRSEHVRTLPRTRSGLSSAFLQDTAMSGPPIPGFDALISNVLQMAAPRYHWHRSPMSTIVCVSEPVPCYESRKTWLVCWMFGGRCLSIPAP